MIKGGDNWNVAKPPGLICIVPDFADGLKWTIAACKLFLFLTIFSVADGSISTIQNNQGASLTTNGAPNGLLGNFNSPTIIFGTTMWIKFSHVRPALAMVLGAIIQRKIYVTSPCGYFSPISIWIFLNMTSYEIAYNRAPQRMKGAVFAIALFMSALSAIILIVPPSFVDPNLIWPFVGLAVAVVVSALLYSIRWTMRKPRSSLSEPHGRSRALLGHRRTEHTFHESSANP
ncbi:hypothetical protein DFH07DRAFT_795911 [Mycena maculata]|uniref:Uncharacterized protein n=1 Tax=Mycena maculata TaxID=230809 RepID=A0AAD7K5D9_9AGAR|nr:hypothetical protein DFH07DRAFT_795911 [Mycena maculata]